MEVNKFATAAEAIRSLEQRGYTGAFTTEEDGLHHAQTGSRVKPEDLTIVEYHRFEGPSSEGDMSVVYAVEARNGLRGVIVDAYGTYANPQLSEILKRMNMKEGI